MRHFPWRECGYAIGFVLLLAVMYVGSYYAMVRREYSPPMKLVTYVNEEDGDRELVYPQYVLESAKDFYRPMHEVDRKIRRKYWTVAEAHQDWLDGLKVEFNEVHLRPK